MNDEREDLLKYLQEKKDALRAAIRRPSNEDSPGSTRFFMQGQLDAYMNVIAFITSGGKLR